MNKNRIEVVEGLVKATEEYGLPIVLNHVFGKDIKIKMGFSISDCSSSIDELTLSVRSQNALKRAQIYTLEGIIEGFNAGVLKQIRNLGKKSYSEIQTKILCYGYAKLSFKEQLSFFDDLLVRNEYVQ